MRRRLQDKFKHRGQWLAKDYDTDEYLTVPLMFRFDNYNGEKSTYLGEELIAGWTSTDEGRKIVTKSSYAFKRDDRIVIGSSIYMITEIFVSSDETLGYGELRGRENRNITMLVLS